MYIIKNKLNNKCYVGAKLGDPVSIEDYHGSSSILNADIDKYGIENFKKIIIETNITTDNNFLNNYEEYCIHEFKTHILDGGYNRKSNGGNIMNFTDEQKENISTGTKMGMKPKEVRNKISKSLLGRHLSDETKRKMSDTLSGRIFSEKHKTNLSKSRVFVSSNNEVFIPTSSVNFCIKNNISYSLLAHNLGITITAEHFQVQYERSINTIGWTLYDNKVANDLNII